MTSQETSAPLGYPEAATDKGLKGGALGQSPAKWSPGG